MQPARSIVEEYWAGAAGRLQSEIDVFNRLIGHSAEMGRENEVSLSRLLEALIPRSINIGSGIIIDANGSRSKQNDIILYDGSTQPSIMAQTSQSLFPIETVLATIEVKSTLDKREFKDAGEKRFAIDQLNSANPSNMPAFYVLGYHLNCQPNRLLPSLADVAHNRHPDALCVINPGIIATRVASSTTAGLCALHERDADGNRISGRFQTFETHPQGGVFRFGESSLPITKTPENTFVAGEPGRALLLFCESLLKDCATRMGQAAPILSHYLTEIARETVNLPG